MPRAKTRPPLGQHFLRDARILERIASSLPIEPGSLVVEIGPGEGALTRYLLGRGAHVTAIEVDPQLARNLREHLAETDLEVIEADILDVDLTEIIRARTSRPALVAGNLPYYITSPILRKLFDAGSHIAQAVLLVQKEVALRLVARKGSRDYGFLSLLCQLHADPEILLTVPASAFRPPPKITSTVVRLTLRPDAQPASAFVDFLKHCFAHPRKTLLNNLAGTYERDTITALPEAGLRAQQLDLEELEALWRKLA
jgi:16S rRNA (adenine1518-N6/adenine1519-N6)-dimethyltransferase